MGRRHMELVWLGIEQERPDHGLNRRGAEFARTGTS